MSKQIKKRADELVFTQGLAETRTKAQALIMAGKILWLHNGEKTRVEKSGQQFTVDSEFCLHGNVDHDVSRGAKKIRGALEHWPELRASLPGSICLDIGASTGGFTQVMLEEGVQRVLALDVGTHQLHERLRRDERVVSAEQQHILRIEESFWKRVGFEPRFQIIVTDVSFISVIKIIECVETLLAPGGSWLFLLKPQFELDSHKTPKGIVKDPEHRQEALMNVLEKIEAHETLQVMGHCDSTLAGVKGNLEFFVWVKKR